MRMDCQPGKSCHRPGFTFLGLVVDFALAQFRVPEKRLRLLRKQLAKALEDPATIRPKEMASITGRIGSARMAVPLAPLLYWDLYKLVRTVLGRPQLLRTPDELREILLFLHQNYEDWNGSSFSKKQGGMVFVRDTGEADSVGVIVTGDLPQPIQVTYTEERRRLLTHEFHSTTREVLNVLNTV